jgi:plasmid maintenance system antidote protein VapI
MGAPAPCVLSEGQRIFAALETKRTALAAVLGVSKGMTSMLATGRVRPSLDLAWRIELKLGIPMSAWCRMPSKAALNQNALPGATVEPMIDASKPPPRAA